MEVTLLSSCEEDTLEIARALGEILVPGDVAEHPGRVALCHVDVYRLSSEAEALDTGLDEILCGDRVCVVEWAEKIRFLLPNECIKVTFLISGGDRRILSVDAPDDPRL